MKKILTAALAVAIALAPASAITQGVITGQQTYVTGSRPDAEPGKYKVVKIKRAKAVHHKHSYKVAKARPGKYKVAKIKKRQRQSTTSIPIRWRRHRITPSIPTTALDHHHLIGTAIIIGSCLPYWYGWPWAVSLVALIKVVCWSDFRFEINGWW